MFFTLGKFPVFTYTRIQGYVYETFLRRLFSLETGTLLFTKPVRILVCACIGFEPLTFWIGRCDAITGKDLNTKELTLLIREELFNEMGMDAFPKILEMFSTALKSIRAMPQLPDQ